MEEKPFDNLNSPPPPTAPSITLSRRTVLVVFVLIAAILFYFIRLIDFQAVGRTLRSADFSALLIASVMLLAGKLYFAVRWRQLMANRPSLSLTFHASNAGHAGNLIIPARGGEVMRILILGQSRTTTYGQATSAFAIERILELIMRSLTLLLAILYGVGLQLDLMTMSVTVAGLAAVVLLIVWLVNRPELAMERIPRQLGRVPFINEQSARRWFADALASLQSVGTFRAFAVVMGWSLVTWFFWAAFFYFTIIALGDAFLPGDHLAVTLAALALSPPSAPTQPGVFHASIVIPLAALGYNEVALTAFAVAAHALEMVWMIGLGLVGLARSGATMRNLVTVT